MIIYLKNNCNKHYSIDYNYSDNFINSIYKVMFSKSIIFFLILYVININKEIRQIDIDNLFNDNYEIDIDFSKYSSEIKPIALYIPEEENSNNQFNLYNNHSNYRSEKIKHQVDLAKRHGIYGFGIYYKWSIDNDNIFDKQIDIFSDNKTINFPFILLFNYEDFENRNNNIKNNAHIEIEIDKFIKDIKKYLLSQNYIKINNKTIISISNNSKDEKFKQFILILKQKALENGIGEVFLLVPLIQKHNELKYINELDGVYDLSKNNISYFSGLIYKNIIFNKTKINCSIYRTSIIEIKNDNSKKNILKDYSPEKYYLLNKILIRWTNVNHDENDKFIFINAWNNYNTRNYLEPDDKYGYASINAFSKALFNIPYKNNNFNLEYLNYNNIIAIQAHVYYENLINTIINITNNIPMKFDLFISTISYQKKDVIDKYLKNYSQANKYEIKIVENKGRDVLPFITQLKNKIKKYKYICHIHTKKSAHDINLGNNWRNYLYNNLLGSKEIILELLNEFESSESLGFIFPEPYYNIIKKIDNYDNSQFFLHKPNIKYINLILKRIFGKYEVGNKLIFPSGNMFWAKVKAIYQIFEINLKNAFPKEMNQTNDTIMHGIERLWLFLVKLNGYYYKMIFKYY